MAPKKSLLRVWPALGATVLCAVSFHWLVRGQVQAARDLYAQFFPETYVLVERWRALEVPLWLPNERLGQPFLALLYTQVFYAPRVITGLLFGHIVGPNVMHVFHCVFAFTGAFLALRRAGRSTVAAFIGSAGWAFSAFFVELSQNLAFASTAAWAGWTWWAVEGLLRAPSARRLAVLALVQAATFHAGAPEMWLWQALLVLIVAAFSSKRRRSFALIAGAGFWAALGFAVVALPAAELILEWTDPAAPAGGLLEWSMSWQQLISIAVPDADFPRAEPFFGADQRFFFTLLLGPTIVALAIAGGADRRARPILALALLCGVLALGSHLLPATWLLQAPPFRFFRFPVKYAAGLLFGLAMLSAFGVDRVLVFARKNHAALRTFATACLGSALGLWLGAHVFDDVRSGFVRGTGWVVLSMLVLGLVLMLERRKLGLAVWIVIELLVIPRRVWPPAPVERFLVPSPIAQTIQSEPSGRVSIRVDMDDPGTPWCATNDEDDEADRVVLDSRKRLSVLRYVEEGLRSTGGYGFRDPWRLARAFEQGPAAFQLSGVTHFVRNAGEPLRFDGPSPSRTELDDLWLWRTGDAFPRGWLVHRTEVMTDTQAFEELGRHRSAPRDFAPVDREVTTSMPEAGCESTVTTSEVRPESITQQVTACAPGVAVIADAWFPGWTVSVDGVDATPVRIWGFLRGVAVPAGPHTVAWNYRPNSFRIGAAMSLLAWVAGLLAIVFGRSRG